MATATASTSAIPPRTGEFHIAIPPKSASRDEALVAHLTKLINAVYTGAEDGIFVAGYKRTNEAEVQQFLESQQLALASSSSSTSSSETNPFSPPENVLGCVRIQKLSATKGEFGILVAGPASRGSGLGRRLIDFAEEYCAGWGATVMQVELLVPTDFAHKTKKWVQAWYERLGYVLVRSDDFTHDYPHLAPLLCTKVDYRVFEKTL